MIPLLFFILSIFCGLSVVFARHKWWIRTFVVAFAALHAAFTVRAWFHAGETELMYFTYDPAGLLFLSVLSLLTITTVAHGFIYLKNETVRRCAIYHLALIALVVSMSGAYLANGMTTVWIFTEATTLAVAALIYHDRSNLALEATWKYVFVCSVGIAMAYIGILFLGFTLSGGRMLDLSFAELPAIAQQADPLYLKIAFVFVMVGYSTKMGLFPMHTVTVDAHTVAPPPVSAFISTTLMNVGFLAIFRIYSAFSGTGMLSFMNHLLILSGLLSLLVSSGYMLKAKHNKRMLAYSSMENMGIVAVSLGVGGIGYYAALLHVVLHSLTKAGLFYQVGQSYKVMGTYQLDESGDYMRLNPAGGASLLLGLLCITAVPPSGLFISEFLMFKAMVVKGEFLALAVTALLLCFVAYALFTRVLHILYSAPRNQAAGHQETVNPWQTVTQFLLFGIVIFICFMQPAPLKEVLEAITGGLPK